MEGARLKLKKGMAPLLFQENNPAVDLKTGDGLYALGLKRISGKLESETKNNAPLFFCQSTLARLS